MKKRHIIYLIVFCLIVFASCKKDKIEVTGFTATEGTRIGVVRLSYEPVSDAEAYEIQRKNPETSIWEPLAYIKSWVPDHVYDDRGIGLTNNTLLPGQVYEYRMKAWPSGNASSPWCAVATGYIFAPSPRIWKVKYEPDAIPENDGTFTFTIKDKLPALLSNLTDRRVSIYRSKASTSNFQLLNYGNSIQGYDSTIYITCKEDNADAPYDYKLEISYNYSYAIVDANGSNLNGGQGTYIYKSLIITGDDIDEGGDSIQTVTYNMQNYNEINSSSTGAKDGVMMCKDGTTTYLAYLDNYSGLAGKPAIMKNTGSSWTNASGTLPTELLNDNSIDKFDFTVSAGIIYLAALGSDSIYIYKNNGTWSANMSTPVLHGTAKPDELNIAMLSNELYVSVMVDDNLKVFKYQGTEWIQAGGDVASGFLIDVNLQEIDGTLYLWYEEAQSGSTVGTLNIKHFNGSSWDNDLQWTKDGADNFDVVKAGSSLYFKCDGAGSGFSGGIFKVTSTSAVTSLEGADLKIIPEAITSDASGNIIATIITAGKTAADFQLGVYIYVGSAWKKVNDDFSETSFKWSSSGVQAINNDIHFVYGLKSSENGAGYSTVLKAKKYSK
jgi:hypothetical protein